MNRFNVSNQVQPLFYCSPEGDIEMKFSYGKSKQADEIVERMIQQNVQRCQSALVDMLLQNGEIDGFGTDDIQNIYVDPSDWAIESVYEFADDNGIELEDDPRKMIREALLEVINGDDYDRDEETEETDHELREQIETDKEDDWKDQIRDWSSENPQEPLEWWLVDSWFAGKLSEINEPIIDNDYGTWWGRTCSGQAISLDPTCYQIAESLGWFKDVTDLKAD